MIRDEVLSYASDKFGVFEERIFSEHPKIGVFRHKNNKKWFAVLMPVDAKKLNLSDEAAAKFSGDVLILNLKCSPDLAQILADGERIIPAYHMNKKHWISVNLAGDIAADEIYDLIDESYELTRTGRKTRNNRPL